MRRTRLVIDGAASIATIAPGRMAENVEGAAAIRQHDLLEELLEVAHIVVEAVDIAAMAVPQHAVGTALAAPVERSRRRSRAALRSRIVSKYFSMHSLRPGRMITVPFSGRPVAAKRA